MSIEYQLDISTDQVPQQVLETLYRHGGFAWSEDRTFLQAAGVQLTAISCGRSWRVIMQESFFFAPDVEVRFRLDKDLEERLRGYDIMLTAVMTLLQGGAGDAVLLFNDETILLERFGGHLALNLDWQTWHRQGTGLITLPYKMQSLPSPLL